MAIDNPPRTQPSVTDDVERRFDYIHGIFLTHYASFIATLLASFAWLAILWTQALPGRPLPRFAMGLGVGFLNALALYFLGGIHLYSRLLTSRFVPGVVDQEIERMPDWERRGWSIEMALLLRRAVVARRRLPPNSAPKAMKTPPFVLAGISMLLTLTAVELIVLFV